MQWSKALLFQLSQFLPQSCLDDSHKYYFCDSISVAGKFGNLEAVVIVEDLIDLLEVVQMITKTNMEVKDLKSGTRKGKAF